MRFPLLFLLIASAAGATPPLAQPLGLQLWSLRDQFKENIPATLAIAKGFGFKIVETAGTYGVAPGDFHDRLLASGLKPISAHFPYQQLDRDLPGVIADAKALGVTYIAIAWIPHTVFDEAAAKAAAVKFNRWGAAIKAAGLKLAIHTHGYEFVRIAPGSDDTPFDVLVRSTQPGVVYFEMDVFWVTHAGVDPTRLLAKYPDRWKLLHLKDIRKGAPTGLSTGKAPATDDVAVGTGQVDWLSVLREARKIGIEYYFIEDESVDPLKNIPLSVRYLKGLGN